MVGCTWNPNIVHQNKVNWFFPDQDLIYPQVARAKWYVVQRLGLTFLFWAIPFGCSVLECIRVPYLCSHSQDFSRLIVGITKGNGFVEFYFFHDSIKKTMCENSLHVSMTVHFNMYRTPVSWFPKVRLGLNIRVDQSIMRCIVYGTMFWYF